MEKRGQLEEIGTTLEDIKWTLKCTNACVKTVNANVKNLDLRMASVEEEMPVFQNLTNQISELKEIVLMLAKETTEKITFATVYTMYQREYSPDSSLSNVERTLVAANVKEIYQDINSYTKWIKWKKEQEENREQLKWSKWVGNEVSHKKNDDDCYLLRE